MPFCEISFTSTKNAFDLDTAVESAATSVSAATAHFALVIVLKTVLDKSKLLACAIPKKYAL